MSDPVEHAFRTDAGRTVAALIRRFGDVELAEEAVQEAFVTALRVWPERGTPPNPAGWIMLTARNAAIDRIRREASRDLRQRAALDLVGPSEIDDVGPVEDDRLRLMFLCCHPALDPAARIALTSRLVGGLTTREIARLFRVPEATMAARLTRAKKKIRAARIPFRIPRAEDLADRTSAVLAVVYLMYTEAHTATEGDVLIRDDLAGEAVRLARVVVDLMPDEPEALGLLALLLLSQSRRPARLGADGSMVRLADQDRRAWDSALIEEGQGLVRRCLAIGRPGPYQIQAAIAAVHSDAARASDTDWAQIVRLYDQLTMVLPTPVVAFNRALAVAEAAGPGAALPLVDALDLHDDRLWHAARGDLLERLGRHSEARDAFRRALGMTVNEVERIELIRRLEELDGGEC